MPDKLSLSQFGQKIKTKYPQYNSLSDEDLGTKVLQKYPEYADSVDLSPTMPTPGAGLGERIDAALAPKTPNGLIGQLREAAKGAVAGSIAPILHPMQTAEQLGEGIMAGGSTPYGAPINAPTGNAEIDTANQQAQAGAREDMAQQGKEMASHPAYTAGAIIGPALITHAAAKIGEPVIGKFRTAATERLRSPAQQIAGAGKGVVTKAVREAAETATANDAARPTQVQEHGKKLSEVKEHNAGVERDTNRKEALSRGLEEGSKRVGGDIKGLEKKVRAQANAKYNTVRTAVGDASVPADNLASAVRTAEGKLRGSQESIKVFRDILSRQGDEVPTLHFDGKPVEPGSDLYTRTKALYQQEGMPTGEEAAPVNFTDLQGYYTELGDKLASGNLPGDVYQAMKSLRQNIGDTMQGMADKKGVGKQFKDARGFYHDFMDTFHEPQGPSGSGSPVAQSLRAKDPENIRAPFTGKAGARGVEMLAKHDPELAKRVRSLAKVQEEHNSIKPGTKKELPVLKPKAEQPSVDIREIRQKAIQNKAGRFGLTGYDAAIAGSTMLSPVMHALGAAGEAFRGGAGVYILSKLAAQKLLENPGVVDWLSQPSPKDLETIRKIPGADKVKITGAISQVAQEAKAKGLPVSPMVLALTGSNVGQPVKNRKEAMDLLQPVQ